jgi:hypothetical protein
MLLFQQLHPDAGCHASSHHNATCVVYVSSFRALDSAHACFTRDTSCLK